MNRLAFFKRLGTLALVGPLAARRLLVAPRERFLVAYDSDYALLRPASITPLTVAGTRQFKVASIKLHPVEMYNEFGQRIG